MNEEPNNINENVPDEPINQEPATQEQPPMNQEGPNQPMANPNPMQSAQASREAYYSDNNAGVSAPKSSKKQIDKKYIFIGLGILLIVIITGIIIAVTRSNNKKKAEESIKESYVEDSIRSADDGTVGTDWKLFRFKIKDQRKTLPLSYKELNSLSKFTYKEHYDKSNIAPGKRMKMNLYKDGKLALYIEAYNPTTAEINFKSATVTKISQIKAHVDTYGASPVTFPGELQVGMNMTQEGLFNIFGETKHIRVTNNDGYISTYYKYCENEEKTGSNYFEIELVEGVIYSLTIDHRS